MGLDVVVGDVVVTDRFEREMQRRCEERPRGVSLWRVRRVGAWLARRTTGLRFGPRLDPGLGRAGDGPTS